MEKRKYSTVKLNASVGRTPWPRAVRGRGGGDGWRWVVDILLVVVVVVVVEVVGPIQRSVAAPSRLLLGRAVLCWRSTLPLPVDSV